MNKLEEIMRALGYSKVSHFAKFLEKDAGSVNKYVKNQRNIGGGFILDLKTKIPELNIEYFYKENEPMFLEAVRTLPQGQNVQSEPLSGGNQPTLEDYRERVRQLELENANLKKKIERLKELNYGLIEHIHDYLQSSNNLKHPANERTKKQPTLAEHG